MLYKKQIEKLIPHLGIIIGFIVISFIYFSPVLEGKKLPQMDFIHAKGMAQELVGFENDNPGESSQWTNSMFGGMPAYQIKGSKPQNVFTYLLRFLRFKLPYTTVAIMFNYLLGFYILLLTFRLNKWLSMAGAIGFAFASYNIIIIAVGHITKAYAIAYMAPAIAGIVLIYRKKYLLGSVIALISIGVEIATTHIQINYYLGIIIGVIVIVEFIYSFREKTLAHFFKATAIIFLVGVLAIVPETKKLWTTYEYSKYSIRGDKVLRLDSQENTDGLDKDYAMDWSYGKMETFTVLIPDFKGGGSERLDKNSKIYELLTRNGVQNNTAEAIAQNTLTYWGDMPFTSAPVYFGAGIIFLFVLGLFIIKGRQKWWIVSATVISIVLSWGNNFDIVTDLFFNYFPLYDKFRTVSMILVIANVTVVLLAFMAVREIYNGSISKVEIKKSLKFSLYITGGITLFFILFAGGLFNFETNSDLNLINQLKANSFPDNIINTYREGVQQDRLYLLRSSAFRSLIFIVLCAGVLFMFVSNKLKKEYFIIGLVAIILVDHWGVDRKYLNSDKFVSKREEKNLFTATQADKMILQDKDINYRVLNLTRSPFTDGYTPYFHKSVGGFHGAKMQRYQDIIEYHLSPAIQRIARTLNSRENQNQIYQVLGNESVLNMLNTKYIILSDSYALNNYNVFGNAWFVKNYKFVNTADEEIQFIGNIDLKETVIIHNEFKDKISSVKNIEDSLSGHIKLKSYKPNQLIYESNSETKNIAVFSEIYYPKGWYVTIDGEKADYFRANYILRAMVIPGGNHEIEFRFEPNSYVIGKNISLISSIFVGLFILISLGFLIYKQTKKEENPE